MQLKIENNNKKELELEEMKNEAEKQNQIAKEHCRSVKAVVMKVICLIFFFTLCIVGVYKVC